jgi:cell division protein FtsQ
VNLDLFGLLFCAMLAKFTQYKGVWRVNCGFVAVTSLRILAFIAVAVLAVGIWKVLHDQRTFPLQVVQVEGTFQRLQRQDVQDMLLPLLETGFFVIDLEEVRNQLLSMPWVANASVKRVWPHKLVILITEQQPIARWQDQQVLTADGQVIKPAEASIPASLPRLFGPQEAYAQVLTNFQHMNKMLSELGLKVVRLELTATGAWSLGLDNGMHLELGQDELLKRVARFVAVYPKMFAQAPYGSVEYVDLRYRNAMAVRWLDH